MPVGEQALPVKSEVAEPEMMKTLPFSLAICCTASATDEVGTSMIMSTLPSSYHCRARLAPTSGLLRWSPEISSMRLPCTVPPKSLIAISAACTEPGPARSAYRPDRSVSTAILTSSSEICARAVPAPSTSAAATHNPTERPTDIEIRIVPPPPRVAAGVDRDKPLARHGAALDYRTCVAGSRALG